MIQSASSVTTIVSINAKFFYAFLLAILAYFVWPSNPHWYGFYGVSIFLALAALFLTINSLRHAMRLIQFERVPAEFREKGKPVKSAALAESEFLTNKGVTKHVK